MHGAKREFGREVAENIDIIESSKRPDTNVVGSDKSDGGGKETVKKMRVVAIYRPSGKVLYEGSSTFCLAKKIGP